MPQTDSRLRVTTIDGVSQVRFIDRNILDEANIQQIADEIAGLIDRAPAPKILICFENVDHLSSAALGALITINNRIKAKGGQMRLSNIDPQIYEVFVITKLNRIFEIHDSVEQAMGSFRA
jgi:anti-sigma B factor antagonist